MVTYLDILNNARAEIGRLPLSLTSVQTDTAEALAGVRAINKVLAKIFKMSVDQDWAAKYTTVNTTAGNSLVTAPTGNNVWDTNTILSLYYEDSAQRYELIQLASKQEGDNLNFNLTMGGQGDNFPKWWYVFNGAVYVLPEPTAVYTLPVYYQALLFSVDSTQMGSTVDMPPDFLESFRLGVEAYLLKVDRDPEWPNLEQAFFKDLKMSMQRNKFNAKNNGLQIYMLQRSASTRL